LAQKQQKLHKHLSWMYRYTSLSGKWAQKLKRPPVDERAGLSELHHWSKTGMPRYQKYGLPEARYSARRRQIRRRADSSGKISSAACGG
jgi:hypothetical protein